MHAYLLALEIEPVDINRTYVALPLHCTVMPWFLSEKSPAEVVRVVQGVVEEQPAIELVADKADLFGADKDVPVNRIADEETLRKFHQTLYDALGVAGAQHISPKWVRDGYTPHVTRQRSGRFEEGTAHLAAKVYLAEAEDPERLQQKKIIYKFSLGSES